jgi:hypothetical protein
MLTEDQIASAYREMTDSTRHLVRWTQVNGLRQERVKPDPETNPLADLDWEKELTWVEAPAEPTRREECTSARR